MDLMAYLLFSVDKPKVQRKNSGRLLYTYVNKNAFAREEELRQ